MTQCELQSNWTKGQCPVDGRPGKLAERPDRWSAALNLTLELAEELAIQALTFIAGDSERLGRFLAVTGIGPAEICTAAREPAFLAGVLDYMASDEQLIGAFVR